MMTGQTKEGGQGRQRRDGDSDARKGNRQSYFLSEQRFAGGSAKEMGRL